MASMMLLLEAHGYEVHPAPDGNHALELLRNGLRPAAVLLDFRMPGMDGGQTLSQIRSLGIDVPAVLVSAVLDVERVAAHHGFDAALPKPLSIDNLLQVVNQLVP
ncbi:MAG: response regulator [Betaproteobacteria bacterium]|nr:MAG: response regulator [Betaproteobacteria bacterium]